MGSYPPWLFGRQTSVSSAIVALVHCAGERSSAPSFPRAARRALAGLGFDDELVRLSQLEGVCFADGGHLGQKPRRFARVLRSCNRLVIEARVAMLNENYTLPTPIIVVRIVATWRSSSPVPA